MSALLWIDEENDEAIDLGNPLTLYKSLAELGRLDPDEFETIHSLPDLMEQDVDDSTLGALREEAGEALKRFGGKLSDHTKWVLEQLGEDE